MGPLRAQLLTEGLPTLPGRSKKPRAETATFPRPSERLMNGTSRTGRLADQQPIHPGLEGANAGLAGFVVLGDGSHLQVVTEEESSVVESVP